MPVIPPPSASPVTPYPPAATSMNMLPAALAYAQKLGWSVIPLHSIKDGHCTCPKAACKNQGKHPIAQLTPHGLLDATTDSEVLTRWWKDAPWANIGVVTGEKSGFVALDVDVYKGGDDALYDLKRDQGELPETGACLQPGRLGAATGGAQAGCGGLIGRRCGFYPRDGSGAFGR